jgi:hypothetical protein
MANKKFLWVMLAGLLAFGLVFLGCDNGSNDDDDNGGGGDGPIESASWFNNSGTSFTIELILRSPLDATVSDGKEGFTVTVDGENKTVTSASCNGNPGKVYVGFESNSMSYSTVVKISYNGTSGAFAGKLPAFADMVVPLD